VLLLGAQAVLDRARRGSEIRDGLPELAQTRAVEHPPAVCFDGELRERRGIGALELPREVGEQALADQLQQDVVVALEGDVDVEVGAGPRSGSRT
jgi:hypothetical protein